MSRILSRPRTAALALGLLTSLALTGCGSSDDSSGTEGGSGSGAESGAEKGTVNVLAAASLTEAFTSLAEKFEADHPGSTVRLSFDSSATLAEQVNQGAPADVLATADERTMKLVTDQGGASGTPALFATNHLQLAVPKANPAGIKALSDLDEPGVRYVVCVDSAPCGKLAATVLKAEEITARPASEEVDVKAVLTKVALDEADAGLVYATDAVAAGDKVTAIDVPASGENLNRYPIAALEAARKPALARAWVQLVRSPAGQKVLADDGFGAP